MFLPNSLLPILLACALAALLVHPLRGHLTPRDDDQEQDDPMHRRRVLLREVLLSFLTACLACLAWHVIGPLSDRWQFLFGNNSVAGLDRLPLGPVLVDTTPPSW